MEQELSSRQSDLTDDLLSGVEPISAPSSTHSSPLHQPKSLAQVQVDSRAGEVRTYDLAGPHVLQYSVSSGSGSHSVSSTPGELQPQQAAHVGNPPGGYGDQGQFRRPKGTGLRVRLFEEGGSPGTESHDSPNISLDPSGMAGTDSSPEDRVVSGDDDVPGNFYFSHETVRKRAPSAQGHDQNENHPYVNNMQGNIEVPGGHQWAQEAATHVDPKYHMSERRAADGASLPHVQPQNQPGGSDVDDSMMEDKENSAPALAGLDSDSVMEDKENAMPAIADLDGDLHMRIKTIMDRDHQEGPDECTEQGYESNQSHDQDHQPVSGGPLQTEPTSTFGGSPIQPDQGHTRDPLQELPIRDATEHTRTHFHQGENSVGVSVSGQFHPETQVAPVPPTGVVPTSDNNQTKGQQVQKNDEQNPDGLIKHTKKKKVPTATLR